MWLGVLFGRPPPVEDLWHIVAMVPDVGVVLMASLLVGPAVAARQWTNRLSTMIIVAALVGAFAGVSGTLLSVTDSKLPTGPMIILSLTTVALLSLFFGSARGLFWDWLRHRRNRKLHLDSNSANV